MIKKIISVFLALLTVAIIPVRALAAAEQKTYVSDIAIGNEAGLTAKGYTVIHDDMLGITDTYIGYKTTTDPSLAITDIKAMNMDGGISPLTYGEVLLQNSAGVAELAEKIRTAVNEFKTRYNSGNPYARVAYDTLNALTYPDTNGNETPLADYLFSGYCTFDDYKRIALMSSNVTILYIFNQLCFGVSDNNLSGETTWIERLVSNGPFVFESEDGSVLDEGSINSVYASEYDMQYMQRAQKLYLSVSDFSSSYLKAVNSGKTLDNISLSDTADEEAAEAFIEGNTVQFDEEAEAVNDSTGTDENDVYVLSLYQMLDKRDESGVPVYPFGTNKNGGARSLAEFFIEVGSMTAGEDAYRLLYPLIASQSQDKPVPLSSGQEIMFSLNGMNAVTFLALGNRESLSEAEADNAKNVSEMLAANNGNPVSIWYDTNIDIYEEDQKGVYWTSQLAKEAAAGGRYDLLTKKITQDSLTSQQKLQNAFLYTAVGALGAFVVAAVIGAVVFRTVFVVTALRGVIHAALIFSSCLSSAACIACIVGTVLIAVAAIAFVAVIVMLIVWLFKRNKDNEKKFELTEIPSVIYDYNSVGQGSSVIYAGIMNVNDVDGDDVSPAFNLNLNMKDTPWVALYCTHDVTVGSPIEVSEISNVAPIKLQRNDYQSPDGYTAVTFFDTVTPANLHEGSSGDKIYAFMLKDGEKQEEYGTEGKYIEDVALVSFDDEATAKANLISRGYTVIDYNLTSDCKKASYIGYKTTDNPEDAVTDLRVAYASGISPDDGSIKYGDAGYAACGNIGDLVLLFTRYSSAGTPLLASHLVVTDRLGAPEAGYEPVNLFCGGPAFDFNNCDGWKLTTVDNGKEGSSKWNSHAYIYFLPSETYVSGELYLGGLAFFSGNPDEYITSSGWTVLSNSNLANGKSDDGITFNLADKVQSGKTELCFSTTYNPYRAIYDIQFFEAEANTQGLTYNLSLDSGAVACDVFQQGGGSVGNNRMVRTSHAYRSSIHYEGGAYYEPSEYFETTCYYYDFDSNSECEVYDINGKETGCNLRCSTLYVTGAYSKKNTALKPISISELSVSASQEYDSGTQTPIRSVTSYYSASGANLAFNDKYRSGNYYLYLGRADAYAEKPKYIASVNVAYVEGDGLAENKVKSPYDSAVLKLIGIGSGELYTVNLTGDGSWTERVKEYSHEYEILSHDDFAPTHYQTVRYIGHDTSYSVALIWVTYTNASSMGISDIEIYKSDSANFKDPLKDAGGSETVACGDGFRVHGKGSYYYLRAVKNNGHAVVDLIIDKDVMKRNYWTSISTDGTVSEYDLYYFKTLHAKNNKMKYFVSGIYSATGATETEAQKALLSQGCRYCCPYNLSPDDNHPVYVGYSLSTGYKNGFSGLILYDAGQNNTVNSITIGRNVYTRVTDSLNGGMYDSIISMYVTKSVAKACENGAKSASAGHYITDIMFYSGTDLNDYVTGRKSLDQLDEKTRLYLKDYLVDASGNAMNWDIVTNNKNVVVNCNIGSNQPVYMYIHYSDNTTPYLSSLNASVFSSHPTATVIITAVSGLLLLALGYCLIKKRKSGHSDNE